MNTTLEFVFMLCLAVIIMIIAFVVIPTALGIYSEHSTANITLNIITCNIEYEIIEPHDSGGIGRVILTNCTRDTVLTPNPI